MDAVLMDAAIVYGSALMVWDASRWIEKLLRRYIYTPDQIKRRKRARIDKISRQLLAELAKEVR